MRTSWASTYQQMFKHFTSYIFEIILNIWPHLSHLFLPIHHKTGSVPSFDCSWSFSDRSANTPWIHLVLCLLNACPLEYVLLQSQTNMPCLERLSSCPRPFPGRSMVIFWCSFWSWAFFFPLVLNWPPHLVQTHWDLAMRWMQILGDFGIGLGDEMRVYNGK